VVAAGARVLVAGSAVFDTARPWEAVRRIREAGRRASRDARARRFILAG
jgi:hypothetical protein